MRKYKLEFWGRTIGAIGISYAISDTVTASDDSSALLALYKKYEHISDVFEVTETGKRRIQY